MEALSRSWTGWLRAGAGRGWAGAGLAVTAAWTAGVRPMVVLARALSPRGELSEAFTQLLGRSQLAFGLALIGAGLLASRGARWAARAADWRRRHPRAGLAAIFVAGVVTAALCEQVVFGGIPHVTDASSHLFQARIFAAGALRAPAPPCWEAFFQHQTVVTSDGWWFTKYPPGQALVLLAGLPLGWPGLGMWLLNGASAAALAWMVGRFEGRTTGHLAGWLWCASPFVWLVSGSFMSHTAAVAWALLAGVALIRAVEVPAPARGRGCGWFTAAGLCVGAVAITRPQDGIPLAVVGAVVFAQCTPPVRRRLLRGLPSMAAGCLGPAAALLGWNAAVYGRALSVGYGLDDPRVISPVLGVRMGVHEANPLRALIRTSLHSTLRLDRALLGWPSSLLPCLLSLAGWRRRSVVPAAWAGGLSVWLLYFFHDYYGFELEARYHFLAAPAWIALAAVAARNLWQGRILRRGGPDHAAALLLAGGLYAAGHFVPAVLWPTYGGAYEQASPALGRAVRDAGLEHAVVLVPSDRPLGFHYTAGFAHLPPFLDGPVLYARGDPQWRDCLRQAFPDRTFFVAEFSDDLTSVRLLAAPGLSSSGTPPAATGPPGAGSDARPPTRTEPAGP